METVNNYRKRVQWRYDRPAPIFEDGSFGGRRTPPKPPRILVHNFPAPEDAKRGQGDGGFRCWTQLPDEAMTPCACGWRPDLGPHYTSHPYRRPSRTATARRGARNEDV
jgi:hypothetical protein